MRLMFDPRSLRRLSSLEQVCASTLRKDGLHVKKILASFLCLAFVFSVTALTVGCGGDKDKKPSGTTAPAKEAGEKKEKA